MNISQSLLIATSLSLTIGALAQNPISPMGHYLADPSAKVIDGQLVVACSVDSVPFTYCSSRHDLLTTTDLRHWSLCPDIIPTSEPLYAPDIIKADGRYRLFICYPDGREGVAVADRLDGPYRNATIIDGPQQIDPCIFIDDDGQAYYFWGQFSAKGAKLDRDLHTIIPGSIVDGVVTEAEHHFHEGSFVFKRNGWYYFVFADVSRQNTPTCLGYAMSRNVMGPYEYKGVIIDNSGCDPSVWNNHGSVVQYGDQWYVLYHRATHHNFGMRKACIEPIRFLPDGTIPEVEMTTQGAAGPLDAFALTDAARACLLHYGPYVTHAADTPEREVLTGFCQESRAAWKYLRFDREAHNVTLRIRSSQGGKVYLRTGSSYGPVVGSIDIPAHTTDWTEVSAPVEVSSGTHAIWIYFAGHDMDMDWMRFD